MTADVDPTILEEWMNHRLLAVGGYVGDLYEDLRDGRNLILLLGALSEQQICREFGRLRINMLRNARVILDFLGIGEDDIAFGIREEDIVNGDRNKTRFIVTMIFRRFQFPMSEENDVFPLCRRNNSEQLVNMNPENVFNHGSNAFDERMPSSAFSALTEPGYRHYLEEKDDCIEERTQRSIRRERPELLAQPILPYEKNDYDVLPNWKFTAWAPPILDAHVGDAKRMLLDAFVIYLARVVGETTVHIGWETRKIPAAWKDGTANYHLVPMIVTVPLNDSWGSVSEVVDKELAILARNSRIPLDQVASSDSGNTLPSVEPLNPWRIIVSVAVGCDLENENRPSRGTVLTLQIRENGEFRWIYNISYLDSDVIARITEHLTVLTSEYLAISSNNSPVCQLNMLSNEERNFLLTELFPTVKMVSENVCLHNIFEEQVSKNPNAIAIIYENERWTYENLNTRANHLAHQLINSGVVPECLIGICVSVSPAMLVGILAIVKAGGTYVPLDPMYPRRHLIEIITDTSVKIIIADENGSQKLGVNSLATITIFDPNGPELLPVANPVVRHLTSQHLACVIYTSSTTGKPKKVMVEHRTITAFCDASESWYQVDQPNTWICLHPISFYISIFEVWGTFSHGGQLVLLSRDAVRSSEAMYQQICEHSVTVLYQTPSAFKSLAEEFIEKSVPEHLRYVAFAGESLDPRILRPLFVKYGHALPQFVNLYCASEVPFRVTRKILDEQDTLRSLSVIGKCLPGGKVYLLDSHCSLVPFGAIGELHVGGECVTRGYLNRPDLTSERFLADPYGESPDARMYKTGDLARYLPDGNLAFISRFDQQIELKHHRIEPREIVHHLRSHPIVRDAFVCTVGNHVNKILVSYIVAEPIDDLAGTLHRYVSLRLPAHMVPMRFVRVDRFPLTLNGKLDIKALPPIDEMSFVRGIYEAPKTEVEIRIANIWKTELGLESVGRFDAYFALDEHSLLAVKVMESLTAQGFAVTSSDLFRFPVLSDMARSLSMRTPFIVSSNALVPGCENLTPDMFPLIDLDQTDIDCIISQVQGGIDNIQDIYALSPLQDSMMFDHQLGTTADPYLLMNQKIFSDFAILQRYISVLRKVIHRHDALRTAFFWKNLTTPAQVVLRNVIVPVTEKTLDPHIQLDSLKSCDYPYQFSLDLQQAPLLRLIIWRTSADEWLLREVIHHIIIDDVSMEIINTEINAISNGREESLPRPTPFRYFIAHVRSSIRPKIHEEFFTDMLAKIDEPTLCYDLAAIRADVSSITVSQSLLSPETDKQLRRRARHFNTTLSTLCHLAWGLCVSKASRRANPVFGTVLSGRMASRTEANSQVGVYMNILPIQLMINETSLNDCVRQTHEKLDQLMAHENASLVIAQRCARTPEGAPLFNSILDYRHHIHHIKTADMIPELRETWTRTRSNYPLTVCVNDTFTGLNISSQTAAPVDSQQVCTYMQRALESIVGSLIQEPVKSINSIQILPDSERQLLQETWNTVEMPAPDCICMHKLFEKQAILTPTKTALIHGNETVTYTELNARANCLAHYLIKLGVKPECLVGICISPSLAMIVGLLAIHKAGGAYVSLDSSYPIQRQLQIMVDTKLQIIIADDEGADQLRGQIPNILVVMNSNDPFDRATCNPIVRDLGYTNLAYVMYTSGSTGQPKGVMVEHRNIVRLFETTEPLFHYSQNDVWCLVHSIGFTLSVWQIWGALRYGGQLVIMSREDVRSIDRTYDLLCKHQVSVLCHTPTQFRMLNERLLVKPVRDGLQHIILVAESLDAESLQSFYEKRGNTMPQLWKTYGTTEVTGYAIFEVFNRARISMSASLIGKHLPDTHLYVLDENRQPAPLGVVGDLYVGSPRLARGYWNRPELTIERFIVNPFSDSVDAHIYRTGDLARFLPDGSLEYIGRDDQQVKLRGYRIELGEVETCLRSHEGVRDARVLTTGDDIHKRLVAYVVANRQTDLEQTLHSYVKNKLPEFMVPQAIMIIDEIPLTHNGKIDLQALPPFERQDLPLNIYDAPRGEVEMALATVWKTLLDVKDVSRHDSFFALGGHSLLAIRMIERMRFHGYPITINDLYMNSTLFELALTALDDAPLTVPENLIQRGISRLTPEMLPLVDLTQTDIDYIVSRVQGGIDNIQDIYALSPLQDGMLFHHLLDTETDPYLLSNWKIFPDFAAMQRYILAVKRVINRHDILRTAFFWKDMTIPAQVVLRGIELQVVEKTLDLEMELDCPDYCDRPNRWSFDLQQAPLLHLVISRMNNEEWLLHEVIHHIIIDNVARDIINTEINAICNEQEESLPRPTPFRNFIAHVRSSMRPEVHEKFFTDMLADIDEPTFCFDIALTHDNVSSIVTSQSRLSSEMKHQLGRQAEYFNTTLAIFCHLAWGLVVSKVSRRAKIVFGTVLSGRMALGSEINTQVGLYINTLPIKLIIDETSLHDCVRQTHHKMGQLMKHEHATLVTAQRCSRIPNSTPLFNSLFNYRHNVHFIETDDVTQKKQVTWVRTQTPYPLTVCVDDTFTELTISSQIAKPVNSEHVCAYMQRALVSIVDSLVQEAGESINSIQISPDSERQLLLETWNTIDMPTPDSICMHQLFEKWAILTPTRTALIHENDNITYTELNARANCLAHYLIDLGVKPECLVGLCVFPSFAMIVGLLAIHKAGGAYVPLDPAYPEQHLLRILTNTGLHIVIADEKGADRLGDRMTDTLVLINPNDRFERATSNPRIRNLSQANLAYVMYTSGSTGQPKGVMIEHHNIVRLFETTKTLFHFSENDVWCLVHSIAFDVSLWVIWGALCNGGQLVILSREEVRSIDETYDLVCKHQVSVLSQSTSQFIMFHERLLAKPVRDNLQKIIFGGESLNATSLRSFYDRRVNPVPQLINTYGPTEVTVFASFQMLDQADTLKSTSPIGKHLPDTQIYVLDKNFHPAPLGVVGDLYIGGPRLARGYWNRPELTIERFIVNPFGDSIDAHIYRTGDLARFLPDGSLEFIGRDDQQVKLRGYRIELGEVETCLRSHEAVRDARVLMTGDDIYKRLVAYVVANRQTDLEQTLRSYARSHLPEFMVPVAIMIIDEIPLTTNGKLDHEALPIPDSTSVARSSYEMPKTHTEWKLAMIWSHLLGIDEICRDDNFFVVGGHSLLAVRMISLIAEQGLTCTLKDLFRYPVLRDLASKIEVNSDIPQIHSAVPVRRTGTEPPLFFVPTGLGDYCYVFALALHIQTCYPIYALPWPPSQEQPSSTMEEMVRTMIPLIKAVQPQGPYRICGYSSGGILCHAIASHLHESGDPVAFVGLIDTALLETAIDRAQRRQLSVIYDLIATIGLERIDEIVGLCNKIADMSFLEFIEAGKQLKLYASTVRSEIHAQELEQRVNFMEMVMSYVPKDLGIVIHQFNASEPSKAEKYLGGLIGLPCRSRRFDLAYSLPNTSIHIVPIPGDHLTMMENSENRLILGTAITVAIHPRSEEPI